MTRQRFKRTMCVLAAGFGVGLWAICGCAVGGRIDWDTGDGRIRTEIVCDDAGENCETVVSVLGEDGVWVVVVRRDVD